MRISPRRYEAHPTVLPCASQTARAAQALHLSQPGPKGPPWDPQPSPAAVCSLGCPLFPHPVPARCPCLRGRGSAARTPSPSSDGAAVGQRPGARRGEGGQCPPLSTVALGNPQRDTARKVAAASLLLRPAPRYHTAENVRSCCREERPAPEAKVRLVSCRQVSEPSPGCLWWSAPRLHKAACSGGADGD